MKKYSLIGVVIFFFSTPINATQIDFTGGTGHKNDATTFITDGTTNYDNASYYEEGGFKFEFLFNSTPSAFASHVGDYYSTGNDVFHGHWADNGNNSGFGELSEVMVSKLDGSTFDLGGFQVSTNTANGGGSSDGNELVWVNSSKANKIFSVIPDDWGLGSGSDPLITIDPSNILFDDILWFSFTNDALSSAVGLGLDVFFLDEAGDLNGTDPSVVPEPAIVLLFCSGLLGLIGMRKKII